MKRFFWLFLFVTPFFGAQTKLETGVQYNFIAKDGQNLYNATLVRETPKAYIVKLDSIGEEEIVVEKNILVELPKKSLKVSSLLQEKNLPRRSWQIDFTGTLLAPSGNLTQYADIFPGFALRLGRYLSRLPYLQLNSLWSQVQYVPIVRSPRRIDLGLLALGVAWVLNINRSGTLDFFIQIAPLLSVTHYNSFTYQQTSTGTGATAAIGINWRLPHNLFFTMNVGSNYLYDQETVILIHGVSLGFGISW
ncbi:MAG: hypothetical protein LDLANPLL_01691 [Turneriella sp.]|nr:hypothetical protein [Turneriella sp.]